MAFSVQLVFIVRWRNFVVANRLLWFVSDIRINVSMAMVLSCVALVATIERSASTKIASEGVVLTLPVIALPACI